jgi:septum formation protein
MTTIVLASTSAARRMLLTHAGVRFSAERPGIDEAGVKARMTGHSPGEIAAALAEAKAGAVASRHPDAVVIGADQVLNVEDWPFDKPVTIEDARNQLLMLRGRAHHLETAACCAQSGRMLWRTIDRATLVMRPFSNEFLDEYLKKLGTDVLTSVGGYKLEGRGIQLFERIEGDYFSILGLPLLPLLSFLRSAGALSS